MSYAVYVYADADKNQEFVKSNEVSWTGTWSSSGSYYASSLDTVLYGPTRYLCVIDNVGVNPTAKLPNKRPNPFAQLIIYQAGDEPPFAPPEPPPPTDAALEEALEAAWAGTIVAYQALQTSWAGTAEAAAAIGLANQALVSAWAGTASQTDYVALQTAWAGTALGYRALQTAWTGTSIATQGTNEAAAAIGLANQALLATYAGSNAVGLANAAKVTAQSGTRTADSALALAATGTNEATAAIALANYALSVAFNGTAVGSDPVAYTALQTAWTGTAEAGAAIGLGNQALQEAWYGSNTAYSALQTAWAGTALAQQAIDTIVAGTDSAAALARANEAYSLATTGTAAAYAAIDLGNQALQTAWLGTQSTGATQLAYTALQTAWTGTAEADAAIGLANQATMTAWAGTGAQSVGVVPWSGTVNINFNGSFFQAVELGGATYFTASNYQPKAISLKVRSAGSYSLAYDPSWLPSGQMASAITAGASGLLILECFGSTAQQTFSGWAATDFGPSSDTTLAYAALQTAWAGTAAAYSAQQAAWQGTALGYQGTTIGYAALQTAWAGTAAAYQAQQTAWQGTTGYGTVPYSSAQSGTIYYDFAGSDYQETTVSGNLWVSGTNLAKGRDVTVILVPDGTPHTLGYSSFKWFGTTPPTSILNKEVMVSFLARDTTIANTRAAVAVEV